MKNREFVDMIGGILFTILIILLAIGLSYGIALSLMTDKDKSDKRLEELTQYGECKNLSASNPYYTVNALKCCNECNKFNSSYYIYKNNCNCVDSETNKPYVLYE